MIVETALQKYNNVSGSRFRGTIYYFGAFRLPAGNASTQRVRSNAKIFRDLGFRVVLVSIHEGTGRGVERRGSFAQDGFHSLSLNVGVKPLHRAANRLIAAAVFRILRMRFAAPAVICYNYLALPQAQIQAYCRLKGIPFASDATEWYGPSGSFVSDLLRSIDTVIRMRLLNWLTDGIITTSPFLTRFYARAAKPHVQLPTLFDRAETGVGAPNEKGGPLSLVFAGNPFNLKIKRPDPAHMKERLDTILAILTEANRDGAGIKLDIYGVDRQQYLTAFQLRSDELDPPWLKFWGQVPRRQVLEATKNADLTIFFREKSRPNIAGFPSKFAESITCGTPVITNPMENIAEFAKDGSNCVLVDPANLHECAMALRRLSGQREWIDSMKSYCAATDPFDYRRWNDLVAAFVQQWLPHKV